MSLSSFESIFHQRLAAHVEAEVNRVAIDLADGSARGGDFSATAQSYFDTIGYIRGLRTALQIAVDVEDELVGKGKGKKS